MTIFFKRDEVKKGVENIYLSSGTNKGISNFRETIPLKSGLENAFGADFLAQ
jgi:hypothetical protein